MRVYEYIIYEEGQYMKLATKPAVKNYIDLSFAKSKEKVLEHGKYRTFLPKREVISSTINKETALGVIQRNLRIVTK